MKTTFSVDNIQIASPCHARWNDMAGDERARFCRQCSKHVFNLSAMTRVQIETLVREKEGKFCGRLHRRADGTMLTADCPSRLRRFRERMAKVGGALCALMLSLLGCSSRQTNANQPETGKVLMGDAVGTPASCATNNPPVLMGIIAPLEPTPTNAPAKLGEIHVEPAAPSKKPSK